MPTKRKDKWQQQWAEVPEGCRDEWAWNAATHDAEPEDLSLVAATASFCLLISMACALIPWDYEIVPNWVFWAISALTAVVLVAIAKLTVDNKRRDTARNARYETLKCVRAQMLRLRQRVASRGRIERALRPKKRSRRKSHEKAEPQALEDDELELFRELCETVEENVAPRVRERLLERLRELWPDSAPSDEDAGEIEC